MLKISKYTKILMIILLCTFINLFAQEKVVKDDLPEVSLTLIPPSPVTDQITLDIRAGLINNTNLQKTFKVTFYLDKEEQGAILYEETLTILPTTSGCVKFPWPTKGHTGDHKIIVVSKSGDHTYRKVKPIQVIASTTRSTKMIDGAFMSFYCYSEVEGKFWNSTIKTLTDNQWGELTEAQHSLNMNIIVVQEVFRNQEYNAKHDIQKEGYKGRAFYPSEIFRARFPLAANDPLEAVLAKADKNGMNVFVGVGLYAWFDFTKGSLEWHKNVAKELWQKYGHHPSFYGWYISEEKDGGLGDSTERKEIVEFFKGFSAYIRTFTPDKPIMLATNSMNVRGSEDTYQKLLPFLDILCPFGFHRMPEGDYTGEEVADKLQSLCDDAGTHFWMDLEVFDFDKEGALVPRPIEGLLTDLQRFPNFEKIICYQFPGLLNSPTMSIKPGGGKTVRLFLDYKKYLDSILPGKVMRK